MSMSDSWVGPSRAGPAELQARAGGKFRLIFSSNVHVANYTRHFGFFLSNNFRHSHCYSWHELVRILTKFRNNHRVRNNFILRYVFDELSCETIKIFKRYLAICAAIKQCFILRFEISNIGNLKSRFNFFSQFSVVSLLMYWVQLKPFNISQVIIFTLNIAFCLKKKDLWMSIVQRRCCKNIIWDRRLWLAWCVVG
jgi:hypothetical protein